MMKEKDEALNEKLAPLYTWLFTEPNPIGINTMLMMLGAAKPVFRLPYVNRDLEARQEGARIISAIGLENCPVGEPGLQVLRDDEFKFTLSGE